MAEFEKEIKKVLNKNNVAGFDFSISELFVSSEKQRADYLKYFRILEKSWRNYKNHYQERLNFLKIGISKKIKFQNYTSILKIVEKTFYINYLRNYLKNIML